MNRDNGAAFLAFISGAAIGAVVGILYAPDKGKNTRDRLSYQLDKYKDKLQEVVDELIEGKEELLSEAKSRNAEVTKATIAKAEQIMNDISALQSSIKTPKASKDAKESKKED